MTTEKEGFQVCVNCGAWRAREIRRDEIYGRGKDAIVIENVPMIQCFNCGMVYLEPEVIRAIDEICAHPEQHTSLETRPVAKIA
jgi:YgiT-type zinc finger domain-containing protein